MRKIPLLLAIIFLAYFSFSCSNEQIENEIVDLEPYPEEIQSVIGRGLVAFPKDRNRIFLSWRLLPNDPEKPLFNVYRKEVGKKERKLELIAQTNRTSYMDCDVEENHRYAYSISQVYDGKQGEFSREATVIATKTGRSAFVFNIGQDYKLARVVTGDLNGDGELEVVIAYANNRNVDPYEHAWQKSEDTIKVAAFLHTGERLWTIDLGWGIEAGGVYSPMVIWDIDADGRAEVLLKTNKSADPRDYDSDRLTVLDGETGKTKNEVKWPSAKGLGGDYNSDSRNYIAIAHLDGKNPYIIVARGLYKTQRIWAYDNQLNRVWERIIGLDLYYPSGIRARLRKLWYSDDKLKRIWAHLTKTRISQDQSRASHSLPIADVNDDGKEEILWGEHCIGENGKDLWVIGERMPYNGQPDIVFVADILPSNKKKEIYYCREGWGGKDENIGMLIANSNGKTIWARWGYTHVDGGWVAKIIPDQEGMQCYGYDIQKKGWSPETVEYTGISSFLWSSGGKLIANPPKSWVMSFPVDWDGDGFREICMTNGDVQKYNVLILTKLGSETLWGADLFGDHREEIVVAPQDGNVYIYFNTEIMEIPARITPLADRQYKNDLSRTAMQFNVIPTEGGYIFKKYKTF
ncbi:MAG: hypothetical protein ACFFCW_02750 [Candidatus Hodarchaeota archaeon]